MMTYKETLEKIHELEKQIEEARKHAEESIDQEQFAVHLERLRKYYIIEHRKAAKRDGEYAMR